MGDGLLPSGITSDPEYYKVKNIIVVIDATRDAAITCQCGTMVSPKFTGSGFKAVCPRCKKTV